MHNTIPLEAENKLKDWESKFFNYMSTPILFNGVPLLYVIQHNDNQDVDGFPHFVYNTIYCVLLKGYYYDSGRHAVHRALVLFTKLLH